MNLLDEFNPMLREARLYEKRARFAQTLAKLTTGKGRKYVSLPNLKKELDADDAEFDILMSDAKKANRYSNKYIFTEVDGEPCIGITASKRKGQGKAMDDSDARTVEPSDVGVTGTKPEDAKEPEVKTDDVGVAGKKGVSEARMSVGATVWRSAMDNPIVVVYKEGNTSGKRKSFKDIKAAETWVKAEKKNIKVQKVTHNVSRQDLKKETKQLQKLTESIDPTVEANLWRAYKAYGWQGLMKSGPLPEGWELMAATEVIEAMARV
jgi:hypothetical protein